VQRDETGVDGKVVLEQRNIREADQEFRVAGDCRKVYLIHHAQTPKTTSQGNDRLDVLVGKHLVAFLAAPLITVGEMVDAGPKFSWITNLVAHILQHLHSS
jgi:hypothetical protein